MRRALPALALAAALAGCGGGLSAEEYRREASRICADGDRETERVQAPRDQDPAAVATYFERLIGVNERVLARFEELDPPSELADAHEEAVAVNAEAADEVERLVGDLRERRDLDRALRAATPRLRGLDRRADAAARELGVPACAES